MLYHITLIRMSIIKKSTNNKCWRDYGKWEPSCAVGGRGNLYSRYGEQYGDYFKNQE